jgi:hypothetical protein
MSTEKWVTDDYAKGYAAGRGGTPIVEDGELDALFNMTINAKQIAVETAQKAEEYAFDNADILKAANDLLEKFRGEFKEAIQARDKRLTERAGIEAQIAILYEFLPGKDSDLIHYHEVMKNRIEFMEAQLVKIDERSNTNG